MGRQEPPVNEWWANLGAVERVLHADRPATGNVLAALALVANLRADVDEVDAPARQGGASWQEVAAALGLHSRQAAQQRWLRLQTVKTTDLAEQRQQRQRAIDATGPEVTALRARARALHKRLARLPDGTGRPVALARLAREPCEPPSTRPPGPCMTWSNWP